MPRAHNAQLLSPPMRTWRERVIATLPEDATEEVWTSTPSLTHALSVAAYERRIPTGFYVQRAVRAFVALDLELDPAEMAEHEPLFANLFAPQLPRRWRGRNFGQWRIEQLGDI